ncbi:MAG: hypothetical protein CVU48_07905 [Candidatus Cloacimonetes bacterium HGW-Cloacimonetes-1]|jgi:hypothetical protein|nr:MAG: hypothetical protein CVU48_07905 [Candidatus Cloacimonetes bacterium HGW-Cloacimonetes-1]
MRKLIYSILVIVSASCLWAQEGPAYTNTNKVLEKHYTVKQKHGKNILTLQTQSTGKYDKSGIITDKVITKGNLTFWGRTTRNQSNDPYTMETLNFDYMNLLNSRSVEIRGANPKESTIIEYDSKGKILSKHSTKVFEPTQDLWEFNYSQVGYVQEYYQVLQDSTKHILQKNKYDYFDNLVEKHYYVYDSKDLLVEIYAMSASDSLLFKNDFIYDASSNMIESNKLNNQEKLLETERCYYDDKNRMIQKSRFVWNPRFGTIPNLVEQSDYEYQ